MSEDLGDMIGMFLGIVRENQDVVQVHKTQWLMTSQRTSFINTWKTAGVLVRPNGMTRYSKCPRRVLKVVFHSSLFQILTRW